MIKNIGSFDADEFIWKRKDIRDGNGHFWNQEYTLPCINVLGFFARRVASKFLGIDSSERSWVDAKTIKSGKISAIISDVSEKQSIVYKSACIESARTEQYHSDKIINENCPSHTWNEEDDAFDQQLEKYGVEKYFQIIQNLS